MAGGYAWVTLATNDSYSLGALVLARSLQQVGTKQQLAVLVTPGVTNAMRTKLNEVFNVVMEVNLLDSKDEANLRLLKRPELGVTFTKLHCWRLTQFEKCVFLDADTLVLENCDELFDREEFSAAPDIGWPDCFNSGVFVFRPSNDTYEKLIQFALEKGSFDGGDQGLLNLYFSDWAHKDISKHLPFIYNMSSTACYSYLPAFKQFGKNAKIIHFLGASKPWLQYFDTETRKVHASEGLKHLQDILQYWWNIFCNTIHPGLSSEMTSHTDTVHGSQSFQNPPHTSTHYQYHDQNTPNSAENYQNVWDPWEEYDSKQIQNTSTSISEHKFEHSYQQDVFVSPSQQICETTSHQSQIHSDHATYSSQSFEHHNHSFQDEIQTQSHHNVNHSTEMHSQQNQLIESHNTNANSDADHHHNHNLSPTPTSSHPQTHTSYCETPPVQEKFPPTKSPPPNDPIPRLPDECVATTTVSNEITLQTGSNEDTNENDSGLAGAFAKLTLGAPRTPEQAALDDHLRRQGWEVGNIDYLGRDSFDNIWNKICQTLASVPEQPPPKTESPRVESKPSEVPPAEVKSDEKADLKSEVQQQTSSLAPESAQQVVAPQKAEAEELLSAAASAAAPSIESAPVPPVSSVPVTSESVAPVSTTPVTSESVSPRPVIAPTTPPVATVPTTPPVTPSAVTPAPAVVPVPATPTTAATLASKTSSEVTPAPVPISSASVTSALSSSSINAPPVTPVPISGTSQVPECSKLLEGTKSVPAATDTALKKSSEAVPDSKDSKPVLSAQAPPKTKITEATPPTTPVSPSKETKPALGVETVQAQEPSAPIPTPRKSSKSDKKTGTKTKK